MFESRSTLMSQWPARGAKRAISGLSLAAAVATIALSPAYGAGESGGRPAIGEEFDPGSQDASTGTDSNLPDNAFAGGDASEYGVKCAKGNFTMDDIKRWASAANASGSEKLVYIHPSLLTEDQAEEANLARIGLFKALNLTSWNREIYIGEDVSEGHCAVYKIDLQKLWGTKGERNWGFISSAQGAPDSTIHPAPVQNLAAFPDQNLVAAERLVYNLLHARNYIEVMNTPENNGNVPQDNNLIARGAYEIAIVCGVRQLFVNRINFNGQSLLYFQTGDPFNSSGGEPIPQTPPPFDYPGSKHIQRSDGVSASEAFHQLPNGLLAFYIWGNAQQKRTVAEQSFAIDPSNPKGQYYLTVGRSCITCHNTGLKARMPDTALKEKRANFSAYAPGDEEVFAKIFKEGNDAYLAAMNGIMKGVSEGTVAFNDKVRNGTITESTRFLIEAIEGKAGNTPYYGFGCNVPGKGDLFRHWTSVIREENGNQDQNLAKATIKEQGGSSSGDGQSGGSLTPVAAYNRFCGECHGKDNPDKRITTYVGPPFIPKSMYTKNAKDPLIEGSPEEKLVIQHLSGQ